MLLLSWMGRLLPRCLRCRRHRCLCACRIYRGSFLTSSLPPLMGKESHSTVRGTAKPPQRERPLRCCNCDFLPLKSPLLPPIPQPNGGRGRGNAHVYNATDHSPSATIAGAIPPRQPGECVPKKRNCPVGERRNTPCQHSIAGALPHGSRMYCTVCEQNCTVQYVTQMIT